MNGGIKYSSNFLHSVNPELERRKNEEKIQDNFDLTSAQILFCGDGRSPAVRINSEVKAIVSAKKKIGVSKKKGEPIYEDELLGIKEIKLTDDDDPNCGHATLLRLHNVWFIFFDFRYNKARSLKHLKAAEEFYETADFAFNNGYWNAFADNLFSATELIVKSTLLSFADRKFVKKTRHKDIKSKYNGFAKLGNVKPTHNKTFNKLYGLRAQARYLKKEVSFSEEEGRELLDIVKEMLENSLNRIK